jgi:hypothetical protein
MNMQPVVDTGGQSMCMQPSVWTYRCSYKAFEGQGVETCSLPLLLKRCQPDGAFMSHWGQPSRPCRVGLVTGCRHDTPAAQMVIRHEPIEHKRQLSSPCLHCKAYVSFDPAHSLQLSGLPFAKHPHICALLLLPLINSLWRCFAAIRQHVVAAEALLLLCSASRAVAEHRALRSCLSFSGELHK